MSDTKRHTDKLAEALAGRILTGIWPPGHKLPSDAALSAEFGVSRTVIREAFRMLSGKGLLQAKPRLGTRVADTAQWSLMDADMLAWLQACGAVGAYVDDMADMRLALEPSLAALAASRADMTANQALQSALRALQEAPDSATNTIHESDFLRVFYTISGNHFASAAAPLAFYAIAHRLTPPPLAAYARMTAAIAQKDPAQARQAALQALIGE